MGSDIVSPEDTVSFCIENISGHPGTGARYLPSYVNQIAIKERPMNYLQLNHITGDKNSSI
jgi:hypothetical protein